MAGKRTGAAAMLAAGRRRDQDTGTSASGDQSPSALVTAATSNPGTESPSAPGAEVTRRPDTPAPSSVSAGATSARVAYQRTAVYLTPELRRWLRETARSLPDGLSASDVIRLALVRLGEDAARGQVELVPELVRQAHEEAERYAGRRNRGLPDRAASEE